MEHTLYRLPINDSAVFEDVEDVSVHDNHIEFEDFPAEDHHSRAEEKDLTENAVDPGHPDAIEPNGDEELDSRDYDDDQNWHSTLAANDHDTPAYDDVDEHDDIVARVDDVDDHDDIVARVPEKAEGEQGASTSVLRSKSKDSTGAKLKSLAINKTLILHPVVVRSPKPSISSKLTSAPANKHVSPCSLDPYHSHGHSHPSSPVTIHHSFLKSSSPAALARRGQTSTSGSSDVLRRHSMGSALTSTASTSSNRRASLDGKALPSSNLSKSTSPRVDSRRASFSGPLSSVKGPSFGRSSSFQSPRKSSSRPATPDSSSKRRSPSLSGTRAFSIPSSPRTPGSSSPRPSNSLVNGTAASRKKASPIFTSNIKKLSSSVDSPNSIASRQSPTYSSSIARRPSSPLSSDRGASNATRRKSMTSESRDPKFIVLPTVDVKAGDDVRLDLRGQKIRNLDCNLVNLTPKLEFVYLRDNKLVNLAGIEVLRRVKVLDLSFNEFKGPGFEPLANCKVLQQLYLAGNQITSLSGLPQLPNLEFLSVAQNKLKSLSMATQPRLQVLAASKNKIGSFKGFPYLPMLEHLRLEENPISEMQHVEAAAIMLCGPTLKKFNDKDLPMEEQELARMYPAHTAVCIRDGWELCDIHEAFDSSMNFLQVQWAETLPPGFTVQETLINQPFEGDSCSCHFMLKKEHGEREREDVDLVLRYQWFVGGKTPTDFVPIEGATGEVYWPKHEEVGHCLKVECTPVLGSKEYPPIFAVSFPVIPGTGCPRVMCLSVNGEAMEGSNVQGQVEIAWCGGTPSKGIVSWLRRHENCSPVVIPGAEELEYLLTLDDVGANLLLMYTPVTQEGVKGEPHFATTGIVQAALPCVRNVQVLGNIVEGNTIQGVGIYSGGREGPSRFEWLREDPQSGEFKLVSSGYAEYTLTAEDVGFRLTFLYTPVNSAGIQGRSVSAVTSNVLIAPPKITYLKIVGDICEGSKVEVSATVNGGDDRTSRVQWYKTRFPDETLGDANLEAISTSKISKTFRIPLGAVGFYLAAKYTPVRLDGECGEPVLIFSDTPVEMLPPSLSFLSISGEYIEGETLTATYGYVGGYEGSSQYSWYLHESESSLCTPIVESTGLLQYHITKKAVNNFVSFQCIPIRSDGAVGETRTVMGQECIRPGLPKISSIQIIGEATEGAHLEVQKTYWGGTEGHSRLQWIQMWPDGTEHAIEGAKGLGYTVQTEDIGSFIYVKYEPIRLDGAKGLLALSPPLGPVAPALPICEFLELQGDAIEGETLQYVAGYKGGEQGNSTSVWSRIKADGSEEQLFSGGSIDLSCEDVGSYIKLVYTPIRMDGVAGTPVTVLSDIVVYADPVAISLIIPKCCQDLEVVPQRSYFGGTEGASKFTWFRLHEKLLGSQLPENAEVVSKFEAYTPTLEDVGMYLALRWVPGRLDGKKGRALFACSTQRVIAAAPSVSNVTLKEVSDGTFIGDGDYYGGFEGESQMSWYRQAPDGQMSLIVGATLKSYTIVDDDYTCSLIFGYTPVRKDGIAGQLVLSDPSRTILPELPRVEKVVLTGKAVEGEVLTALEMIPSDRSQQHLWDKFKSEVKYQWSRYLDPASSDSFEELSLYCGCSYRVRTEDIGSILRCECVMTDVFGRSSVPVSGVSATLSPGMPRVTKLEIAGEGFHTNSYAVRCIYSGGKEGKSAAQWFRAMAGSPDLIPIAGEVGRLYEANVDDVGYRLVVVYTPVREDGVEGAPVSASTELIAVEPEIAKEVKQKLELGAVKFEALRDRDRSPMKVSQQNSGSFERRVLNINKKRVKVIKPGSKTSFPSTELRGTYTPPFHMEVFRNDQLRFKIVVDSENEVDLMVQTRHMRDVIVLVIRGLAQRFNSTPLNLLLKM